ncbi:putative lipoprotein [Enterobacteriaceae bacterium ATCC 29904]|nr:putative lipoprotein [Enterobacteriaceae bacterium ATCC 29904]
MRKFVLLASIVLTGCATSPQDCDLHAQDPSFITKLSCATSGGYRQQVDQQEQQVRLSQYKNESAKQQQAYTQNRQQNVNQQVTDEKARLNAARTDLSQTLTQLKTSKIKSSERQQEITRLQDLQRQSQRANSASEISEIEKKIAQARQRIKVLEEANTIH